MIDFVDMSLFVRIKFWLAIEKSCSMYLYIVNNKFNLQDLSFLH